MLTRTVRDSTVGSPSAIQTRHESSHAWRTTPRRRRASRTRDGPDDEQARALLGDDLGERARRAAASGRAGSRRRGRAPPRSRPSAGSTRARPAVASERQPRIAEQRRHAPCRSGRRVAAAGRRRARSRARGARHRRRTPASSVTSMTEPRVTRAGSGELRRVGLRGAGEPHPAPSRGSALRSQRGQRRERLAVAAAHERAAVREPGEQDRRASRSAGRTAGPAARARARAARARRRTPSRRSGTGASRPCEARVVARRDVRRVVHAPAALAGEALAVVRRASRVPHSQVIVIRGPFTARIFARSRAQGQQPPGDVRIGIRDTPIGTP